MKYVSTADAENILHFLEDEQSHFSQCFLNILKSLVVSASNNLFSVMFKILQASQAIAVNSFFKKSSQK
jgi:hypothetical protein